MSNLAGVFYGDCRPMPADCEPRLFTSSRPSLHRAPGLLMAGGDGRAANGNVCAFDGWLHNRKELLAEFAEPGMRGCTDAELALSLYAAMGCEGFGRLIGDWSLAIWDSRERSVVLATDYAGTRPLYYRATAECLAWSSCLRRLAESPGAGDLDEEYIANFLVRGTGGCRTPYTGIQAVPPHTFVKMRGNRVSTGSFWSMPADAGRDASMRPGDYEEQFRSLFREAVAARLSRPGPACAELSGGLDSSSIVSMAARLIAEGSVEASDLLTFSYCQPGSTDEPFFRTIERTFGRRHVHIDIEQFPAVSGAHLGAAPEWWETRFREVAGHVASAGSTVFLTGQMGDLVTGNWLDDSEQVADLLTDGDVSRAIHEAAAWSRALRVPIYSVLWRGLRSLARSGMEGGPGPDASGDSVSGRLRKQVTWPGMACYGAQARPSQRKHCAALAAWLEGRRLQCPEPMREFAYSHPFCHRPLVEFMMSIPASIVCRPGEPRRLMRRALNGIVPDQILRRRTKDTYDRAFLAPLRPIASGFLENISGMRLVRRDCVDALHLAARLGKFCAGQPCNASQLRQIILLELWLRSHST